MELLSDVDGVVADFILGLLEAVGSELTPKDIVEWDVVSQLPTQDERAHALLILSDPEFWANLPVKEGAKEGVNYLLGVGYKISWVTSPWESCEGWESARREWLNKHFEVKKRGQAYIPTSAKEKIVGDVFIDDKPKNVVKWQRAHPTGRAYLFDAPYNQNNEKFHWSRRINWKNVKEHL